MQVTIHSHPGGYASDVESSRAEAGEMTLITKSDRDPALPCYIRLSRAGNSFTGYFSTDGTTWEVISADPGGPSE